MQFKYVKDFKKAKTSLNMLKISLCVEIVYFK